MRDVLFRVNGYPRLLGSVWTELNIGTTFVPQRAEVLRPRVQLTGSN